MSKQAAKLVNSPRFAETVQKMNLKNRKTLGEELFMKLRMLVIIEGIFGYSPSSRVRISRRK